MAEPDPQTRLWLDQDTDRPQLSELAGGSLAAVSRRAPGKPPPNEDAAMAASLGPGHAVLAVADGAGGMPAGEQAAEAACRTVLEHVRRRLPEDGPLGHALVECVEEANRAVRSLGVGAGTTLVLVEVHGGEARSYNVGDSRMLITGQRGRVKKLTLSHSPVGYAVESGLIDERTAINHEDRHFVSNLLGTDEMRIEIGHRVRLAPRDTILIGSDGLFDGFTTDELVARIRSGSLERCAGELLEACSRRMAAGSGPSPDDVTFLLLRGVGKTRPRRAK